MTPACGRNISMGQEKCQTGLTQAIKLTNLAIDSVYETNDARPTGP